MGKVLHIALNTFRESVRDKVLYVIAFFAMVLIGASQAVGWISVGEQAQIVKHFSLAAVSFFGALIAVFVGTNLIYKEIEKRTIYTVLSKPVHRWQFVFGKFIGLMTVLLLVLLGMGGVACLFVHVSGGEVDRLYLQALGLIYFEYMVVTALAVFFSTVSTPILAAIFTFCAYLVGQVTPNLMELVRFKPPEINYHLRAGEIRDWRAFCRKLLRGAQEQPAPNPYRRFWKRFGPKPRALVRRAAGGETLTPRERKNLRALWNLLLERRDLYRRRDFAGLRLPGAACSLLEADPAELTDNQILRRNRFLLEAAFPEIVPELAKIDTVARFTQEHLTDMVSKSHWLLKPFSQVMYHLLPNLTHFQLRNRVVYGPPLRRGKHFWESELFLAAGYGIAYSAAVLLLCALLFDRKRF